MSNPYEKPLNEWSDEELINEYESLHQLIYEVSCFGTTDVVRFYAIEAELVRRGYSIRMKPEIVKEQ